MSLSDCYIVAFAKDDEVFLADQIKVLVANGVNVTFCQGCYTMNDGRKVYDDCAVIHNGMGAWEQIKWAFDCEESVLRLSISGNAYLHYTRKPIAPVWIGEWQEVSKEVAEAAQGYTYFPSSGKYYTAIK